MQTEVRSLRRCVTRFVGQTGGQTELVPLQKIKEARLIVYIQPPGNPNFTRVQEEDAVKHLQKVISDILAFSHPSTPDWTHENIGISVKALPDQEEPACKKARTGVRIRLWLDEQNPERTELLKTVQAELESRWNEDDKEGGFDYCRQCWGELETNGVDTHMNEVSFTLPPGHYLEQLCSSIEHDPSCSFLSEPKILKRLRGKRNAGALLEELSRVNIYYFAGSVIAVSTPMRPDAAALMRDVLERLFRGSLLPVDDSGNAINDADLRFSSVNSSQVKLVKSKNLAKCYQVKHTLVYHVYQQGIAREPAKPLLELLDQRAKPLLELLDQRIARKAAPGTPRSACSRDLQHTFSGLSLATLPDSLLNYIYGFTPHSVLPHLATCRSGDVCVCVRVLVMMHFSRGVSAFVRSVCACVQALSGYPSQIQRCCSSLSGVIRKQRYCVSHA